MKQVDLRVNAQKLRVLVYGMPGSGKTTFVGTAALDPRTAPVLHIDVSGNPESLLRHATQGDVYSIDKLQELNAVYDWLFRGQPHDHVLVTDYGYTPGYKTLVFDGITAIQRKSFQKVMGEEQIKPGTMPAKAEWDHYRSVLAHMTNIATAFFQTLNIHVLMTALESVKMIDDHPYIQPALQGQAKRELPGEALTVMRIAHRSQISPMIVKDLKATNAYSIAQLQPSSTVYAKDQHLLGVDFLVDPTVGNFLDRIAKKGGD